MNANLRHFVNRISDFLFRIQGISLKWKLLIPFLLFSFIGTVVLAYIGLSSQQELIRQEERRGIRDFYSLFLTAISHKGEQALSMATIVAQDHRVQELLAQGDLDALREYTRPLYQQLKMNFGIQQFHFHIPPGKSFLRMHALSPAGEMISYRRAIMDVMKSGIGIATFEWGLTGLGMRGIVPIYHNDVLAGSFEIGFPFGTPFLEDLKTTWGPDVSVFEKRSENKFLLVATTKKEVSPSCPLGHLTPPLDGEPVILIAPAGHPASSILVGPIRDHYGEVMAIVEVEADRTEIIRRLARTLNLMIVVGATGILISFALIWVVAILFTRPIEVIVNRAREIAEGRREARLKPRPDDEIGRLTQSLNIMLDSLKERRRRIQEYARTLERKVEERTADLVFSEEKYRTLVDNLPLCVYRILYDGTTEFVNPYFTEKLGYTPEEVVSDKGFWAKHIWECDREEAEKIWEELRRDAKGFRVERVVKDREGRSYTFIDHAIPARDDKGDLKWLDGIMMDITMLKRLQDMALQTEEIKVLGEISARFAHEMRNPLVTAGGFARRLRDDLPKDDKHRQFADIIVEEVARLEYIVKVILSSIEPFTLSMAEVDLNPILRASLQSLKDEMIARGVHLQETMLPFTAKIQGDADMLGRAFDNILKHAVLSMYEGDTLFVSTRMEHDHLLITVRYRAETLAEEDLEQFFFPRFTGKDVSVVHDLPLTKIIIHRHGGKIDVSRKGEDVVLNIQLPLARQM
ncbi:MAG: PAS domain S-box protein [Deltaproteobacteria bacterium]|nr:PAS domain S-box protein [Deltaproteobacteria bacterium]